MNQSRSGRPYGRGLVLTSAALALCAVQLAGGRPAAAQSKEELDKARTQFLEGVSLAAANNCAGALSKYQAVANVKMTAQVAYNIAECQERLGKLVSAFGSYRLAASLVTAGKPKEVASQVGDRITSIEARIPTLTIERTEQTARIELDGTEIGTSQIGVANLVDPGTHTVSGKIGETEVWRETVQINESERKTITVKIDLEKFKPPAKPTATAAIVPLPTATAEPPPPPSKAPAFVVGGIGLAALGAGVGLFVASRGSASELEKLCGPDNVCPASAKATYDSGRMLTGVSEALFAVGVAGLVTGVVLLVVRSSGDKPQPAATTASGPARPAAKSEIGLAAHGGPGAGGLSVVGRF